VRASSAAETIRRSGADVVCLQEAMPGQLRDLLDQLPGYGAVGRGRERGGTGEHVPVLFLRDRLGVEAHRDFWLSDDPEEEGSLGWDAENPRICTAAVLAERGTGDRFAVFNTHLDQRGERARIQGAYLILKRMPDMGRLPAVVAGDFNAHPDSEPVAILRAAGFHDVLDSGGQAQGPNEPEDPEESEGLRGSEGTYHGFTGQAPPGRIDYILCDAGWRVASASIDRRPAEGRFPSDHFPICADLVLDPLPEGVP
jgi:endonuclease/exonuclease/phosphatase family metal-dependent hydrolase